MQDCAQRLWCLGECDTCLSQVCWQPPSLLRGLHLTSEIVPSPLRVPPHWTGKPHHDWSEQTWTSDRQTSASEGKLLFSGPGFLSFPDFQWLIYFRVYRAHFSHVTPNLFLAHSDPLGTSQLIVPFVRSFLKQAFHASYGTVYSYKLINKIQFHGPVLALGTAEA